MNFRKFLFAGAMASAFLVSCSKENLVDEGGVKSSNTDDYSFSNVLSERIMQKSMVALGQLSDQEFVEKAKKAQEMLTNYSNPKVDIPTSEGGTPLTDVFYIYEGLFNSENGNLETNFEDIQRVEQNFTIQAYQDSVGEWYITNSDLATFYSDLATSVGIQLNTGSKDLIMCDLNLLSLDEVTGQGVIVAGLAIGNFAWVPYFTPNEGYWAAEKLGTCANNTGSIDAADFIRSYANSTSPSVTCPDPNLSVYAIAMVYWVSNNRYQAPSVSDFMTNTRPYYWKGEENVCLGNTTQEWQALYSNMDILLARGMAHSQSVLPPYIFPQFLYTDYKSHSESDLPDIYANINFYHGGVFTYGRKICNI